MKFHSTDQSCRFRSFTEAESYAAKIFPLPKRFIKRMCLGCRRREVYGNAKYCEHPGCIRKRVLRKKVGSFAHSESSTYGGS